MSRGRGRAAAGTPRWSGRHRDLTALHHAALEAADPEAAVRSNLRLRPQALRAGPVTIPLGDGAAIWLVALGKAAPAMGRSAAEIVRSRLAGGVVAYSRGTDPGEEWPASIRLVAGRHPLPDRGSLVAGARVIEMLGSVAAEDVVLVLVSGGGSAVMEALQPGVGLGDLRSATRLLQRAGADIGELNTVRRALSRLKGGGIARLARPARLVSLLLSDVVGDRLETIASGPTVPSPTGPREALQVLERRRVAGSLPGIVRALRQSRRAAGRARLPAPTLDRDRHVIVGSNRLALAAVEAEARRRGFRTLVVTTRLEGEAREAGRLFGSMVRSTREDGRPSPPPLAILAGGETTVTVTGEGCGGRNHELALGAALALDGCPRAALFSFATDGMDGSTAAAGAIAYGDTVSRAGALGLSPHEAFRSSDTGAFFRRLGDSVVTGPSGTNVNDIVVALVYP
jgi:hydroxypyruvate reductase